MDHRHVLVVDDDHVLREFLAGVVERKGYTVDSASDGTSAIRCIRSTHYDLVLTDMRMPRHTGIDVLNATKEFSPETQVVVITGFGTIRDAVELIRTGAFDYITKPCRPEEIELLLDRVFTRQKIASAKQTVLKGLHRFSEIKGKSPEIRKVFDTIGMVSNTDTTVLIQGETGTGKELVARAIHYGSRRRNQPFVAVSCAALVEGLVESELFGHERGAFTGAAERRKGRFEAADRGSLLLDEVSEIRPAVQAKLLRVLQERAFERIGHPETIQVDVRIIATTNRDLWQEIEQGRFRKDLFYRLNVVHIYLPPLRDRKEDIPVLAEYFLKKYGEENGMSKSLSKRALDWILNYNWPGNVRQLENCIKRAVIMSEGDLLYSRDFLVEFDDILGIGNGEALTLKEMEKRLLLDTLEAHQGNKAQTCKALGISVRTLRNKLNAYRAEGASRVERCL